MRLTVQVALAFHVFIAVAIMVMVCGRRGIGPQPGPALGMFEVFGRTGPQTLGGAAISDHKNCTEINLPISTTLMFRLWRKHRY